MKMRRLIIWLALLVGWSSQLQCVYSDDNNGCYTSPFFTTTWLEYQWPSDITATIDIPGTDSCTGTFQYRIREEWADICNGQQHCSAAYDSGWTTVPGSVPFSHVIPEASVAHNTNYWGSFNCNSDPNGVKTWFKVYTGCANGTCEDEGGTLDVCFYGGCTQPSYTVSASPTTACSGDTITVTPSAVAGDEEWRVEYSGVPVTSWTTASSDTFTLVMPPAPKTYTVKMQKQGNPACYTEENFTITEGSGCNCVIPTYTLNNPPSVCDGDTFTLIATPTGGNSCLGQFESQVSIPSQGWSSGWTSGLASTIPASVFTTYGTSAYEYEVRCLNDPACIGTLFFSITVNSCCTPPPFTVNITGPTDICAGSSATLTANPSGAGPYSYLWSNSQSGPSITVSSGGTYDVTVTETGGNGCDNTASHTVTLHNNPSVSVSMVPGTGLCPGGTVDLTANPSGGTGPYTYSWTTGDTTQTITVSAVGNVDVTVTDANGCTANHTFFVYGGGGPGVTISGNNQVCNGGTTTLTANPSGGTSPYSYSWSGPGVNGQTTASVTVSQQGNYTVTITDAATCTSSASEFVTQLTDPYVYITPVSPELCSGGTMVLTANPSGGMAPYTYAWTGPGIVGSSSGVSITVDATGSYDVTITDANGCTDYDTVYVSLAPSLNLSTTPSSPEVCAGGTEDITVIVTGGVTPYSYSWSGPGIVSGGTSPIVTVNAAGNYTITVTDANGCTGSTTVTVGSSAGLNVNITPGAPNICSGGSATLTANPTGGTGTYTYLWAGPGVAGQTTSSVTATQAGVYDVTVTDTAGCSGSGSASVTVASNLNLTFNPNPPELCTGGVVDITGTPSGGTAPYTYTWSGPGIVSGGSSQTVTVNVTGIYTLTVTDANSCSGSDTVAVITAPALVVAVTPNSPQICAGGTTVLTAIPVTGVPNYTYSWSGPGIVGSSTLQNVTVDAAGTYTATVTDAYGCTGTDSATVTVNSSLNITITPASPEVCPSGTTVLTATPAGGQSPFTYGWSGPGIVGSTNGPSVTVNATGSYTVSVTDSMGCTGTQNVTVNSASGFSVTITPSSPQICAGGQAVLTATPGGGTGPFSYSWSGPGIVGSSTAQSVTVDAAGSYTVTVTDAQGCTGTQSETVTTASSLNVTITPPSPQVCGGGTTVLTATPSGGTAPYSYSWTGPGIVGSSSGQSVTVNAAGSYSVTVTDNNGCSGTDSVTVSAGSAVTVSINPGSGQVCGGSTVTFTSTPSGGTAPYSYSWSGPGIVGSSTLQSVTVNAVGSYTVTVTDANGCTGTASVNVTACSSMTVSISGGGNLCPGQSINVTANPSGGTAPYTYSWTGPGIVGSSTTQTITVNQVGTYVVTVTDSASNTASASVAIIGGGGLTVSIIPSDPEVCLGDILTLTASTFGGTGPYTYAWTGTSIIGGTSGSSISLDAPGTYSVVVTDANGCTGSDATIVDPCSPTCDIAFYCPDEKVIMNCSGSTDPSSTGYPTIMTNGTVIDASSLIVSSMPTNMGACSGGAGTYYKVTDAFPTNGVAADAVGFTMFITNVIAEFTLTDGEGEYDPISKEFTLTGELIHTTNSSVSFDLDLTLSNFSTIPDSIQANPDPLCNNPKNWVFYYEARGTLTGGQGSSCTDVRYSISLYDPRKPFQQGDGANSVNCRNGMFGAVFLENTSCSVAEIKIGKDAIYTPVGDNFPISTGGGGGGGEGRGERNRTRGGEGYDCEGADCVIGGFFTLDLDGFPPDTGAGCDDLYLTYSDVASSNACEFEITRTWTMDGACIEPIQCEQYIAYFDDGPPVMVCPAWTTIECGDDSTTNALGTATPVDQCASGVTVTYIDYAPWSTCPTVFERAFFGTDDCGNVGVCEQIITIEDTQPPTLTCPADITLACNQTLTTNVTGSASATDSCGVVTITYSDSAASTICPITVTRTWIAADNCGNQSICDQTITINDTTDPVISSGPLNQDLGCNGTVPPPNTGAIVATDNCGAPVISHVGDTVSNSGCNQTITRRYRATDSCGNTDDYVQTFTRKVDTTPPTLNCPANVTLECDASTSPAFTGTPTFSDGCGGTIIVIYTDSTVNGSCANEKILTRTWKATDECGNVATCNQTMTIRDTIDPSLHSLPSDMTIECGNTIPGPPAVTASDNCDATPNLTYAEVQQSLSCPNLYRLRRTWTATDDCGNSVTAVRYVYVQDTQSPSLSAPIDVTIECDESTNPTNTGQGVGSDACAAPTVTYSDALSAGTCANASTITRTWTVTDGCGNTVSADQIITIRDITPPTINCPADATYECVNDIPAANPGGLTATDNCTANGSITKALVSEVVQGGSQSGGCPTNIISAGTVTSWSKVSHTTFAGLGLLNSDQFGHDVTNIGDLDRDGVPDMAVGVFADDDGGSNRGAVRIVFMNADGTVKASQTISHTQGNGPALGNSDLFGYSVGSIGDIDDDGVQDLAVSARDDDDGGTNAGAIYILFMNTDGTVKASQKISELEGGGPALGANDYFGSSIAGLGSANTGPKYIAVGALGDDDGGSARGAIYLLLLDTSGTVTFTRKVSSTSGSGPTLGNSDQFGLSVSFIGDVDGDGIPDIAVGARLDDDGGTNRGAVYVLQMLANGNVKTSQKISHTTGGGPALENEDRFGNDVQGVGDLNGDGIPDLIVGARLDDDGGSSAGAVYVLYLAANGSASSYHKISETSGNGPNLGASDFLGRGIANLGDIDGDGWPNIAVGAFGDDDGGGARGAVYVMNYSALGLSASDPITIIRRYSATDQCGNVGTCDQVITIQDNTPPNLTCPVNVTLECDESTAPANTGTATSSDNCAGVPTIAYSDAVAAGTCADQEVITRTWSTQDPCGNTVTCDQIITIVDTTDPVTVGVPGNVTIECDQAVPGAPAVTATDNCDPAPSVVYTEVQQAQSCPYLHRFRRQWVVSDRCGNSITYTRYVYVRDTTDPVLTKPANITIECDESTAPANTGSGSATDNCDGSPTVTYSDSTAAGSCPDASVITRTWTATDHCNNTDVGVQTITVRDATDPVITTCPANVTVECSASTAPANTGTAVGTDNCDGTPVATYIDSPLVGGCASASTITRTWTLSDNCGNTDTCVQTISVIDTTSPVITCPANVTINCEASTAPANTGSASAVDNCDATPTIGYSDNIGAGSCTDTYTITRTWTATDDCGNASQCVQTIAVRDITDPVITCPPDVSVVCNASTDPADTGTATATDNCDPAVVITYSDSSSGSGCNTTVTRTWTATDRCGNTANCVQTVISWDVTAPTINCPADVSGLSCIADVPAVNTGSVSATDDCTASGAITIAHVSDVIQNGVTESCDTNTITTGTVLSYTKLSKSTDAGLNAALGGSDYFGTDVNRIGDLNRDGIEDLAVGARLDDDGGGNRGAVYILFMDTDGSIKARQKISHTQGNGPVLGNSDYFGQAVDVIGDLDGDGVQDLVVGTMYDDDGGSNRGAVYVLFMNTDGTVKSSQKISSTIGGGPVLGNDDRFGVAVTGLGDVNGDGTLDIAVGAYTDDDGGTNRGATYILFLNADGTVSSSQKISQTVGGGPALNNSSYFGKDLAGLGDFDGDSIPDLAIGAYNRTRGTVFLTLLNANGTVKSTQEIDYNTGGGPSLPSNVNFGLGLGAADDLNGDGVTDLIVGAHLADPSGKTNAGEVYILYMNANGTVASWYQITDGVNNGPTLEDNDRFGWATAYLGDLDNDGWPNFAVGAIFDDDGASNAGAVYILNVASRDVNPGDALVMTRTYQATDVCGNASICRQTFTIDDNIAPVLTCPANVTIECTASTATGNTGTASAVDACGGAVTITYSDATVNGACTGETILTRTWSATDPCGNTSTCDQTITLEDTTAPTLTCAANVTIECDESTAPANTGSSTTSDACDPAPVLVYSDSQAAGSCTDYSVITRTWTSTDDCGNSANCDQTITIVDTTAPVITCPADVTLECAVSTAPADTAVRQRRTTVTLLSLLPIRMSCRRALVPRCRILPEPGRRRIIAAIVRPVIRRSPSSTLLLR